MEADSQDPRMDEIVAQARSGASPEKLRRIIYAHIMDNPTPQTRLDAVRHTLNRSCSVSEGVGLLVQETWSLLQNKEVWEGTYRSTKEAIADLDTPQLQNIRKSYTTCEVRKQKHIKAIRAHWVCDPPTDFLQGSPEHCLRAMASVCPLLTYDDASALVEKVRDRRLRRGAKGRGATIDFSTGDWSSLKTILARDEDLNALRAESSLTSAERRRYGVGQRDEQGMLKIREDPMVRRNRLRRQRKLDYRKGTRSAAATGRLSDDHNEAQSLNEHSASSYQSATESEKNWHSDGGSESGEEARDVKSASDYPKSHASRYQDDSSQSSATEDKPVR